MWRLVYQQWQSPHNSNLLERRWEAVLLATDLSIVLAQARMFRQVASNPLRASNLRVRIGFDVSPRNATAVATPMGLTRAR